MKMHLACGSLLAQTALIGGAAASAADASDPAPVPRPSPTLNQPAPPGAIVLFDGRNTDAWASQRTKAWNEADGPADWKVTPGDALEVVPGAGSIITKQRFSDFKLHLEFRLLGGKTNGGVYLQARYELNINDSFDKPAGSQCGAFANLAQPIEPGIPMAMRPLQWQTFDVDFFAPRLDGQGKAATNARATVLLNGIVIHDNVELGKRKGAAKRLGDATDGPLMLQEHGTAYQFRNIWIVDKAR